MKSINIKNVKSYTKYAEQLNVNVVVKRNLDCFKLSDLEMTTLRSEKKFQFYKNLPLIHRERKARGQSIRRLKRSTLVYKRALIVCSRRRVDNGCQELVRLEFCRFTCVLASFEQNVTKFA